MVKWSSQSQGNIQTVTSLNYFLAFSWGWGETKLLASSTPAKKAGYIADPRRKVYSYF